MTCCPLCGSSDLCQFFQSSGWSVLQCKDCTYAWVVDAPDASSNRTGAFGWGEDVYRESQKRRKMYVDRIRRVVKYNPQPQKWLDVGCAGGGLLQCVSKMGWYVEGLEPGPAAGVVSSKLNFVIHQSDLRGAHGLLGAEQYGVVSYFHVLEHVFDPIQELLSVRQILSSSGIR